MKNRGPAMQVHDGLEDDSAAGAAMRHAMGERIVAADASQFNSVGVQLGYYYDSSPICVDDDSAPPAFSLDKYVPTSRPGSRAPHVWLRDGSSLYDLFGRDFTLLRLGIASPASDALEDAARRGDAGEGARYCRTRGLRAYENFPLVMVRPDQHVAWRGHTAPPIRSRRSIASAARHLDRLTLTSVVDL